MMKKINIVVCGKFHYGHYCEYLYHANALSKIYFSHRFGALRNIPNKHRFNFFAKEYVLGIHLRFFKEFALKWMMPVYHNLWQFGVLPFFKPSAINLFLLHGNCHQLIKKAKNAGGRVIGEAVNLHPLELTKLMEIESNTYGLPSRIEKSMQSKILHEIQLCDYILTPSRAVKDSYVANGFKEEKIFVLDYGCNAKLKNVCLKKIDGRKVKILFVGQISIRKGLHHLLRTLQEYGKNSVAEYSVTLVGREDPAYLAELQIMGYPFQHIQHVDHTNMRAYMAQFDLLILPSLEDGFGMVVMEALEAGLPVLVSKYAGASEVIDKIGGGLIVDPRNHQAIFESLESLRIGAYKPLVGSPRTWSEYAKSLSDLALNLY